MDWKQEWEAAETPADTDKVIARMEAVVSSQLDQEWANAEHMFFNTKFEDAMGFTAWLRDADNDELIDGLLKDSEAVKAVRKLAFLAIQELVMRNFRREEEDG